MTLSKARLCQTVPIGHLDLSTHCRSPFKHVLMNSCRESPLSNLALVDTGATFMCVTDEIAHQLNFDTTEVSQQFVRTADGSQIKLPKIAPVEITFENRTYVTEAVVLGDGPLMGVLPIRPACVTYQSHSGRPRPPVNCRSLC